MLRRPVESALPTLIGVEHQIHRALQLFNSLIQHLGYQGKTRSRSDLVGQDLAVVQIHDGRQIELLQPDFELRNIGHPLLIGPLREKVTLQQIRRYFADQTFVRPISFWTHQRFEVHVVHQTLNPFFVDRLFFADRQGNTSIAETPLMLMVEALDGGFQVCMLVRLLKRADLIVEGTAREIGQPEQAVQRKPRAQRHHGERFFLGGWLLFGASLISSSFFR
ncbi:hypothetical protein D3C84_662420 [compost metagenome]